MSDHEQPDKQHLLRQIPAVGSLLEDEAIAPLLASAPRGLVVAAAREAVEQLRKEVIAGKWAAGRQEPPAEASQFRRHAVALVRRYVERRVGPHYRRVINATGVILHTALGRAVLCRQALEQIGQQLCGYSLLQADVDTGRRTRRDERIEWLLRQLTGTEAATVVNNNAAATLLVLNTVAAGREVIVSRGQLIEIGGSFRLPEVMAASGVRLVEVGTTNKTHLRDYRTAIGENTAAIMRVHPSNYKIIGFTSEVPLAELRALADEHNLVLIDDVGAGALFDFSQLGLQGDPVLGESIRTGADLVTCSADKLIGGPQGGIILGKTEWIEKIRKNPLARVLRVDKLTLAALEATLVQLFDTDRAFAEVPVLQMLRRPLEQIAQVAQRIAEVVAGKTDKARVTVADDFSQTGSGSLPGENLPTRVVAVEPTEVSSDELARRLRLHTPPVFARIHSDRVLFDPRTLLVGEEQTVIEAILAALESEGS